VLATRICWEHTNPLGLTAKDKVVNASIGTDAEACAAESELL